MRIECWQSANMLDLDPSRYAYTTPFYPHTANFQLPLCIIILQNIGLSSSSFLYFIPFAHPSPPSPSPFYMLCHIISSLSPFAGVILPPLFLVSPDLPLSLFHIIWCSNAFFCLCKCVISSYYLLIKKNEIHAEQKWLICFLLIIYSFRCLIKQFLESEGIFFSNVK